MGDVSVLIVDDDDVAIFLMRRVLRGFDRIDDVRTAADGLEGLAELDAGFRPGIILLDVNMPRMNGFEFLEAYGALDPEVRDAMVVVMLTTSLLERDRQRADASGLVERYLNKPLTAQHVEEMLAQLPPSGS